MALPVIDKKRRYLEFEKSLAELDAQIAQLKSLKLEGRVDVSNEIKTLELKSQKLLKEIFANLTPYQKVQLSRHPDRPTCLDYIEMIFEDFIEFHGDRNFMDDRSIVAGIADLSGKPVIAVGHQKGRNTQENLTRNFGMPKPEGYRKALRVMRMAERWHLPLITLIDTPGAYPGIEAEERGQAEAIAKNIIMMSDLKAPIVSVILGEGGSGGALAIAVADRLMMFEYSIYSVISPEGCAAITWKDGSFASKAAEALQLTAEGVQKARVADKIIKEPLGGAHRDPSLAASALKSAIESELKALSALSTEQLLEQRYKKYRNLGVFNSPSESKEVTA